MKPLRLEEIGALTFAPIDNERFPAPALARDCLRSGGNASAVFNIVNEGAVALFTKGLLRFVDIVPLIERGVARFFEPSAPSVEEIIDLARRLLAWVEEEGPRHTGGSLS
jgi:1-deoxy-D-xylulose-5-phosphate reductoisomerase